MKNNKGCIHIIIYLLIFLIFSFTLYSCLEILDLIEVPEKYSVSKWISENFHKENINEYKNTVTDKIENVYKNVKVEIENKTSNSNTEVQMPDFESYQAPQENKTNSEIANSGSEYHYYYYQLDDYAKIIYNELYKNLDNMKSGTYNVKFGTTFDDLLHQENGEEMLNNSFQLAINALNFDNPNLFYLDISKIYLLTRITTKLWITTYEVEIGASDGKSYLNEDFPTEESVNQAQMYVESEKNRIKNFMNGDTQSQIRTAHDYLIQNLEYDSTVSKNNIYNIYGALVSRSTVCEGYARAFKSIMDDINIPCIIACGTGINSVGEIETHAWNYVQVDGNWYAIDVTWDDPIIIGNGYVSNSVNYKYYLKGSNEFFTNHTEDGRIVGDSNFKYPTLSVNNYMW